MVQVLAVVAAGGTGRVPASGAGCSASGCKIETIYTYKKWLKDGNLSVF
jgi:hypothetical protein